MTTPVYIPTDTYNALVAQLTTPITGPDLLGPVDRAKLALGEIANIWPASLLDEVEAEPGVIAEAAA